MTTLNKHSLSGGPKGLLYCNNLPSLTKARRLRRGKRIKIYSVGYTVRILQSVPRSLQDPVLDTTGRTLDPILSTESGIELKTHDLFVSPVYPIFVRLRMH